MFEEAENFAGDIFRGGLPYYLLLALPVLIICSANPVSASEYHITRMSQFDVNGAAYGCRASALSLEARSRFGWTNRHCVVVRLEDITIDEFHEIRQKAGGLVVLLPKDVNSLTREAKEHLNLLEQAMLLQPSSVPVYFSHYNAELEAIIGDITDSTKLDSNTTVINNSNANRKSAVSELFSTISANGYQITVTGGSHAASKNSKIPVIQGELVLPNHFHVKPTDNVGDVNTNLPIIIISAHLQTFGLINDYPLNSDAAVLMSLIELFSKLHSLPNAAPKYRLIFLLTESGPLLNFQGVKKWLDENVALQNVEFVLCLDTISQGLAYSYADALYMHVSKPPKEGSSMATFYKYLKAVVHEQAERNISVEGVHKKINLAETQLAWAHERFSMKRFPAFTLSSIKSPKQPIRTTIFKDSNERILTQTQSNAQIIAEALARYVYQFEHHEQIFSGSLKIDVNLIKTYINIKSALHNNDLKDGFEKYLKNVKLVFDKPDAREPDFMLYDGQDAKMNIYRVKPAVFDLFLTIIICLYLTSVYFVVQYFPYFYELVCKLTKVSLVQSNGSYAERTKAKLN